MARTFQAGRLFTGLDVLDNLAVTGVGLGHSRAASEAEASDLAALIKRVADELGIGVLLIEHNVGLVLSVSHHVYVLDAGQVIEEGDRARILSSRKGAIFSAP